jgi:hypothetical protein
MSAEQFREDLQTALDRAIVNEVDPEAILSELADARERVERVKTMRGDAT